MFSSAYKMRARRVESVRTDFLISSRILTRLRTQTQLNRECRVFSGTPFLLTPLGREHINLVGDYPPVGAARRGGISKLRASDALGVQKFPFSAAAPSLPLSVTCAVSVLIVMT